MRVLKGDLIKAWVNGDVDYLMHGCNCQCAMGSGIAGALAKRFPEIPARDRAYTQGLPNINKLGHADVAEVTYERKYCKTTFETREFPLPNTLKCINAYTQFEPGPDFMLTVFRDMLRRLPPECKGKIIGIPLIGCGIGGGNWVAVQEALVNMEARSDIEFYVYLL